MVLLVQWLEHIDVPRQQGTVAVQDGIVDVVDAVDRGTALLMVASEPNIGSAAAAANHDTCELACIAEMIKLQLIYCYKDSFFFHNY